MQMLDYLIRHILVCETPYYWKHGENVELYFTGKHLDANRWVQKVYEKEAISLIVLRQLVSESLKCRLHSYIWMEIRTATMITLWFEVKYGWTLDRGEDAPKFDSKWNLNASWKITATRWKKLLLMLRVLSHYYIYLFQSFFR